MKDRVSYDDYMQLMNHKHLNNSLLDFFIKIAEANLDLEHSKRPRKQPHNFTAEGIQDLRDEMAYIFLLNCHYLPKQVNEEDYGLHLMYNMQFFINDTNRFRDNCLKSVAICAAAGRRKQLALRHYILTQTYLR